MRKWKKSPPANKIDKTICSRMRRTRCDNSRLTNGITLIRASELRSQRPGHAITNSGRPLPGSITFTVTGICFALVRRLSNLLQTSAPELSWLLAQQVIGIGEQFGHCIGIGRLVVPTDLTVPIDQYHAGAVHGNSL